MRIKNLLCNLVFILTPILSTTIPNTNTVPDTTGTQLKSNLFLNEDTERENTKVLSAKALKRKQMLQSQVDQNAPEFVNYVEEAMSNIENITKYSDVRKKEIRQWLTEEYINLPTYETIPHRKDIFEKISSKLQTFFNFSVRHFLCQFGYDIRSKQLGMVRIFKSGISYNDVLKLMACILVTPFLFRYVSEKDVHTYQCSNPSGTPRAIWQPLVQGTNMCSTLPHE